jgi:hypothetical protein
VTVTGIGFHDVDYHSGDPYDNADWSISTSGGAVTWSGGVYATNPNGNALRFATLYTFWFDADREPAAANASLGLFKPGAAGTPNSIAFAAVAPSAPPSNPADLDGNGVVNAADLAHLHGNWGGTGTGDVNDDGTVDATDLAELLGAWG